MLGKNAYDAYGIPKGAATATSADDNIGRFQYTGQIWLPELGMYYYKARMMSPTLGRFMQTDPIGYDDGMNWYNYVGSDPVNYVDPTGKGAECLGLYCNEPLGGGSTDDSDTLGKYRREFNQALLAAFGVVRDGEDVIVVKARRKAKPSQDWCGSSGSERVPDGNWGNACKKHDACYGNKGSKKESCDIDLAIDIHDECYRRGISSNSCAIVGTLYGLGLLIEGIWNPWSYSADAYKKAQKK